MGIYKLALASILVAVIGRPVLAQAQDQKLFSTQTPAMTNLRDGNVNYELGMRFTTTAAGKIKAIRFYKSSNETGTHTGRIFSASGRQLASVTFSGETASGWQQQALATPLSIAANTEYVVSVNTGGGYYVATTNGLASQVSSGNLRSVVGKNGVFGPVGVKPSSSYQNSNYFRDVLYAADTASTPIPPQSGVWNNLSIGSQTANFNVSFDATPSASMAGSDVVIGLSRTNAAAYSDLAAIVRFGNNGVDARNGASYVPAQGLAFSAGTKYRVDIAVNMSNKTYTVKVGPSGGSVQTLGSNLAFRSEQASVSSLSNLANFSAIGGVTLSNLVVSAGAPSPLPSPTPTPAPAPAPAPIPGSISHGKDLTLSMVGPAAIGITSFTSSGSAVINNASSSSYIRQINSSATYDGITVNGAHLLIQGVSFSGSVNVYSPMPVVFRGCKIKSGGSAFWTRPGAGAIYLLYSDISGPSSGSLMETGVFIDSSNVTVFRNHIWNIAGDGFSVGGKNNRILENYVEKFLAASGAHHDGLQACGNNQGMNISRNKILLGLSETGAINLGAWCGVVDQVTVDSNYLAGGGYTLYGNGTQTNTKFTNNILGTDFYSNSGYWGPHAYWPMGGSNVWSGNKFSDGRPLN